MSTRKIERNAWSGYCEHLSKGIRGKRTFVEVASPKLGDQVEAKWLPISGISYDPKNDLFDLALEGLNHLIRHPREFHVEEGREGLSALQIVDEDDNHHIVTLKDPLMLPAA